MKIIAVAMQKGGVGKSNLTRSLAVAAAQSGLNVLALDMDSQQSTSQWGERREAELPAVQFVTEIDLPKMVARAQEANADLIIIDTPPARSSEAPAAVEAADLVLIPCTADIEAFEQLPRTVRLARTTGTPAAAVLTLATPNSKSEEDAARGVFDAVGVPMVPGIIHRFKVHRDASREGKSAQELEPNSKAANEIAVIWQWVCAELQIGTSARVHNKARK